MRMDLKSVTFLQGTLQACDPACPLRTGTPWGRVGYNHPRYFYRLHYLLGSKDVILDLTCIGRIFSIMLV
jgi:hypothetical protein